MIWKWVRYPNQGHRALEQATESGVIQPSGQPRRRQGGQGRAPLFGPEGCEPLPLREGLQCFCGFQGKKGVWSSTTTNIILILGFSVGPCRERSRRRRTRVHQRLPRVGHQAQGWGLPSGRFQNLLAREEMISISCSCCQYLRSRRTYSSTRNFMRVGQL